MFTGIKTKFIASILLLAALSYIAAAQVSSFTKAESTTTLQKRLQQKLDDLRAKNGFPGATAAVVMPDGQVISISTGLSDVEAGRAMKPTDRILAGSIGKTYFAAVMMRLVFEKKLDLDAKISRWISDEPWFHRFPNADTIVFRQMLNHTSGIPEHAESPEFTAALRKDPDKNWTPLELLSFTFDKPAKFPAGQGWSYADTNFILAGYIVEKITRRPLYDQVREQILRPLKLNDTIPSTSRSLPGLVQGYSMPNSPFGFSGPTIHDGKFVINPQAEWTGGGFLSTSTDLARWAWLLYQGKAFDPSILPVMEAGVPARTGKGDEYGLGVQIRHTQFGITYGHGGWFPGYISEMEYFPDKHVAMAIQFNTDDLSKTKGIGHNTLMKLAEAVLQAEPPSTLAKPAQ
ncbi:MAG TPA: serine hydrolase domain-containing protein [Candidatus Angelobacter sp.]|jgi:D-alanyl-D-alanine carboxypeptidase